MLPNQFKKLPNLSQFHRKLQIPSNTFDQLVDLFDSWYNVAAQQRPSGCNYIQRANQRAVHEDWWQQVDLIRSSIFV